MKTQKTEILKTDWEYGGAYIRQKGTRKVICQLNWEKLGGDEYEDVKHAISKLPKIVRTLKQLTEACIDEGYNPDKCSQTSRARRVLLSIGIDIKS